MDRHTFIGKRKIGNTDIDDFTDIQGIGSDPLYRRYESISSVVKRIIDEKYRGFLATPNYSEGTDTVNWYIDEWTEFPEQLTSLKDEKALLYRKIKDETLSHYKQKIALLSGEELQVMTCALRYIDDDFIYCTAGKVYLVVWGMTPDTRKHISKGELIQGVPYQTKYKLRFDVGANGRLDSKFNVSTSLPKGTLISVNDIPHVIPNDNYEFTGWSPSPIGLKVDSDIHFVATYRKIEPISEPVITPEPAIDYFEQPESNWEEEPADETARYTFFAGEHGEIVGESVVEKPLGRYLTADEIPTIQVEKGYTFIGWDTDPLQTLANNDVTFTALYKKKEAWYTRLWLWLSNFGCWRWLLWLLAILLLLWLFVCLFKYCSDNADTNGVAPVDRTITNEGDTIDDNGYTLPIGSVDGRLPDDESDVVAPVRGEDGVLPPIQREPGTGASVDDLATDFKKAYPEAKYSIIGFDRNVKSMVIQIPESERNQIRQTINQRIPNHKFIVFDEEIYELRGTPSANALASAGWHLQAVRATQGWEITKGNRSVKVAIVDDGIEASHPMFAGRIIDAYNVYTQNNRLSVGVGHGTHVAGLAVGALSYVKQGAAGIAPDCSIMPVQVFDNGMCPLSALISGIMYAVHKDADVVNVSIGPNFKGLDVIPEEQQKEIARTQFKNLERLWLRVSELAAKKKTVIVFAAGNDNILSSVLPNNRNDVTITVGAVDQRRYPTDFTNYGERTDISAPGKDIYSAWPVNSFAMSDGTSMAAPIVAGTIALMKTLKKDITAGQVWNVLYRTGADVYGNMPPMILVDKALVAVQNGDFSEPSQRTMPAIPGENGGDSDKQPPTNQPPTGNSSDIGDTSPTPREGETDYDAIRRKIATYKQKIKELEKLLPENKNR